MVGIQEIWVMIRMDKKIIFIIITLIFLSLAGFGILAVKELITTAVFFIIVMAVFVIMLGFLFIINIIDRFSKNDMIEPIREKSSELRRKIIKKVRNEYQDDLRIGKETPIKINRYSMFTGYGYDSGSKYDIICDLKTMASQIIVDATSEVINKSLEELRSGE